MLDDDADHTEHHQLIVNTDHDSDHEDSSDEQEPRNDRQELKKELTVFNAVTIVVGQIIGSGYLHHPHHSSQVHWFLWLSLDMLDNRRYYSHWRRTVLC